MKGERKRAMEWVKKHKKELLIAGVSFSTILLVVVAVKKIELWTEIKDGLVKIMAKSKGVVSKNQSMIKGAPRMEVINNGCLDIRKKPHYVSEHLRTLPAGRQASVEKLLSAKEHGFILLPGQTWVEAYRTGNLVA